MVLMFVMLGSLVGALGLVAATYVTLRSELKRLQAARRSRTRNSPPCFRPVGRGSGDGQPGSRAGRAVFRRIGGERFYPDDRLDEDLHLRDLAPFATEEFCGTLEESLGLEDNEILGRVAAGTARHLRGAHSVPVIPQRPGERESPVTDQERQNPVWDRALDG